MGDRRLTQKVAQAADPAACYHFEDEFQKCRLRGLPPVPFLSRFGEVNVRTYVTCNGKPGIYFFSLDASKRAPVEAARLLHLPYLHAGMKISGNGERTGYDSERSDRRGNPAVFSAHYGPTDGAIFHAQPGTTLHWLTERYCLYAVDRHGGIFSIDIHHWPWPLQSAVLILSRNTMAESHGVRLSAAEPLLTFTKRLDVLFWPPAKVQA